MNKAKNHFAFLLVTIIILVYTSCNIYRNISTNVAVDTNFSKYRTFAWLPDQTDTTNLPYNNEIIRNNIRNYFGKSFAERGYTVNLDTPDVLLKVFITNKKKENVITYSSNPLPYYYCNYYYGSTYYYPYDFNYYYRYSPGYCSPPNYYSEKQEYIEGSIILNVIDRKLNKLVWSGIARGDIYDPSFIDENIHPAVEAIMNKYPVKPIAKNKKRNVEKDDTYK
jgi:hypothetical protein